MCWLHRKPKQEEEVKEVCEHKFKRFQNTIDISYHETENWAKMITNANFVCIHCKFHKQIVVQEAHSCHWNDKDDYVQRRDNLIETKPEEYGTMARVMGDIAEFQLVDKAYLEEARKVFPNAGI